MHHSFGHPYSVYYEEMLKEMVLIDWYVGNKIGKNYTLLPKV